jgi:poly(3-hydroxybutyrate) depolymerase
MNGLFVLLNDTNPQTLNTLFAEQGWGEFADSHDILLFFLPPGGDLWQEKDLALLDHLYSAIPNWWYGGYSILTAQRYVVGIGSGAALAEKFCKAHAHQLAAAVLVEPGAEKENSSTEDPLPLLRLSFEKDPSLSKLWSFLGRYLRYKINNEKGVSAVARRMDHLTKEVQETGGIVREWYVFAPENAGNEKLPLVMVFHGITSNGKSYLEQTQWDVLARRYKFVVVAPTGFQNRWNASGSPDYPDDVAFVSHLIEDTAVKYTIDRSRIYISGFSMGAAMVHRLMISLPFTFAAGAAFSGQLFERQDDRIMVCSDNGRHAYDGVRNDIPRALWQFYGDREIPGEYPGDRDTSDRFWRKAAGFDESAGADAISSDQRLSVASYAGLFFEYRSTAQLGLGHAYYADLHEMAYTQLFLPCKRRDNPIISARAVRKNNDIQVQWQLAGENPLYMLIVPIDGFQFSPVILKGDIASATLCVSADRLWILPFYKGGTALQPFEAVVE